MNKLYIYCCVVAVDNPGAGWYVSFKYVFSRRYLLCIVNTYEKILSLLCIAYLMFNFLFFFFAICSAVELRFILFR